MAAMHAMPASKPDGARAAAESIDAFAIRHLGGKGEEIFSILSKDGDLTFKEITQAATLGREWLFYMTLMHNCSTTLRDGINKLTQS